MPSENLLARESTASARGSSERVLRVGILGASGIGRIHARELRRAGAEVVAILGSSDRSAQRTAGMLEADFGIEAQPFTKLEELLALPLDAVVVATPHELHFDQIVRALETDKLVFCEKPLFWEPGLDRNGLERRLSRLEELGARSKLGLNVGNVEFLRAVRQTDSSPVQRLGFRFYTNGPHIDEAIGVDLLPHALSLLVDLDPGGDDAEIEGLTKIVMQKSFQCRFRWKGIECEVDLREDPDGPKALAFRIEDAWYERVAHVTEGEYRAYVRGEDLPEREVQDPFRVFLDDFVHSSLRGDGYRAGFDQAARIQRMMFEVLA